MTVLDTTYNIQLLHDFYAPNYLQNYFEVKAKYDRRIKRFFDLMLSNKKILFVRLGLTREQTEHIDYIIHALYPSLNYTLLVLNSDEQYTHDADWGLERVRNFYLRQTFPYFWSGDTLAWTEILSQFPVLPSIFPRQDDLE